MWASLCLFDTFYRQSVETWWKKSLLVIEQKWCNRKWRPQHVPFDQAEDRGLQNKIVRLEGEETLMNPPIVKSVV